MEKYLYLHYQESDVDDIHNADTTDYHTPLSPNAWKLLWFLSLWQSVFNILENALQYLLRFLKYILNLLAISLDIPSLKAVSEEMPLTMKTVFRMLDLENNDIVNYVVCPKCHSLHEYEECIITLSNGRKGPKRCHFVQYPNHPHPTRRMPCNTQLL